LAKGVAAVSGFALYLAICDDLGLDRWDEWQAMAEICG